MIRRTFSKSLFCVVKKFGTFLQEFKVIAFLRICKKNYLKLFFSERPVRPPRQNVQLNPTDVVKLFF
jgi:hypothetical protein